MYLTKDDLLPLKGVTVIQKLKYCYEDNLIRTNLKSEKKNSLWIRLARLDNITCLLYIKKVEEDCTLRHGLHLINNYQVDCIYTININSKKMLLCKYFMVFWVNLAINRWQYKYLYALFVSLMTELLRKIKRILDYVFKVINM